MIINEVKLSRGFFFLKEDVVILTSNGKISLNENWDENFINKLNKKLKGFKIESSDDFTKLKNTLKDIGENKYSIIEKALMKSIDKFWRFFNPAAAQVPRPMSIVLKKNNGIKEFVVFSLNTKSFDGALNANRAVADYLAKKIKDPEQLKQEEILMTVKEAIDKEHDLVDFELRMGVVFNNYNKGKYEYAGGSIDVDKQY